MSLVLDGLHIVSRRDSRSGCVLRAMAGGAVNSAMSTRLLKQLSGFFKLEVRFSLLLAARRHRN